MIQKNDAEDIKQPNSVFYVYIWALFSPAELNPEAFTPLV